MRRFWKHHFVISLQQGSCLLYFSIWIEKGTIMKVRRWWCWECLALPPQLYKHEKFAYYDALLSPSYRTLDFKDVPVEQMVLNITYWQFGPLMERKIVWVLLLPAENIDYQTEIGFPPRDLLHWSQIWPSLNVQRNANDLPSALSINVCSLHITLCVARHGSSLGHIKKCEDPKAIRGWRSIEISGDSHGNERKI